MSTLLLLGLLQGCMILYYFIQRRDQAGSPVFTLFTAILMFIALEAYLNRSGLIGHALFLLNSGPPFVLLVGPLLLLYTRQKAEQPLPRFARFLHLSPFVFYFLYSFLFFLQPTAFKRWVYAQNTGDFDAAPAAALFPIDPLNIQGWVVVELMALHLISYGVAGFFRCSKGPFEAADKKWLQQLHLGLLIGGLLLFASEGGVVEGRRFFDPVLPRHCGGLAITALIYLTSFKLISSASFLQKNAPKYHKSALSPELRRHKLERILQTMEEQKPYLDKSFSLAELAKQTAIPAHHLSQILNEELKTTFFELVNQYRVEAAKNKLEAASPALKVEYLAYEVGYKSKSAFYAAFKKQTTMTPAQYRNMNAI